MTDEEIRDACDKFMADLEAKGATRLYMAFAYLGSDRLAHTAYTVGINTIEALGISQLFVKRAMRAVEGDQSGINPDSPPAK